MQKILIILFLFCFTQSFAQSNSFTNDNRIYLPNIKTALCYNTNKEQSIPLITLRSGETITFSFDDLLGGTQNYWYTIEHCTSDWQTSKILNLDYLEGFGEDRLNTYKYSSNTARKYTHYELVLPNSQVAPKISGNYILKIYLDGDKNKPAVSQRFYVLESQVGVGGEVGNPIQVEGKNARQKINFIINYQMAIANPYQDIKAIVMQNFNPNTAQINTKPAFVKPGQLIYNDVATNTFYGGNEFRRFDTRSIRSKGANVREIYRDSKSVDVFLFPDASRNTANYSNEVDEGGNFYVRNTDGRDNSTEAEYMGVLFTLNATPPSDNGDAYVIGRFNNYALTDQNKMIYDPAKKQFYCNLMLKQGLYDYEYTWFDKTAKTSETNDFEGSFFQTENSYQIFVYYKKPGMRWETLVGFSNLSNRITSQ